MLAREWFPFYVNDWLTSGAVRAMSGDEVKAYLYLLAHAWYQDGIKETVWSDRKTIAAICGISPRLLERLWPNLSRQFTRDEQRGVYVNPKLESVRLNLLQGIKTPKASEVEAQGAFKLQSPSPSQIEQKGSGNVKALIDCYYQEWVEMHRPTDGKPPRLSRADRGQAATMIREYGIELACSYVRRYLRDGDPWFVERRHPLSLILRKVNEYRTEGTKAAASPALRHGERRGILDPIPAQDESKDGEV